uniref:Uncharacterized protein n=1 Tax=Gopherus evgoodei TaxID=1825980 RepID=A0A8C4Y749_9SAUR
MTELTEKENDPQNPDAQRSPGTISSLHETKMQRLKRSLSLKTILRSKSVENFFLRSNSELKLPCEVLLNRGACPPPPVTVTFLSLFPSSPARPPPSGATSAPPSWCRTISRAAPRSHPLQVRPPPQPCPTGVVGVRRDPEPYESSGSL